MGRVINNINEENSKMIHLNDIIRHVNFRQYKIIHICLHVDKTETYTGRDISSGELKIIEHKHVLEVL